MQVLGEGEAVALDAGDVAVEEEARARIARARSLLVVTGAGVCAESGVPTFRGADGLWQKARPFVIEVNAETTPLTPLSDVSLRGLAGELLPRLLLGDAA